MYHGEKFNTITHLIGVAAALAGAVILVYLASRQGDALRIVSLSIYGLALFLLYLFSVLYHSSRPGKWKVFLRKLDHIAIYLLIAGTYTPFMLITLRGAWGWSLFGTIWFLAVCGILLDVLPQQRRRKLAIVMYVLMGWLCLIAIGPLWRSLSPAGLAWLLAGGLFYTGGIVFYALDHKLHFHGIWHLFVLAGSVCHYLAVLLYVL